MNSRILIMIMRILILISKESNRFVKKKPSNIVVLNSSPPCCTCLVIQHPFTQKISVFKSKCVRYVSASQLPMFKCKTSSKRNFLFNLSQKCLLISQLISNDISTVSTWCELRTRWFCICICIYICICILYFKSPLSRFHCFHLVKPGQDDFDLVLLWWLSNLVFYLRPKFLSMKVFACFSLNHQPDSNAALPWLGTKTIGSRK